MSETPDGEVDYGSFDSVANPNTDSDHAWSTPDIGSRFTFVVYDEDKFKLLK